MKTDSRKEEEINTSKTSLTSPTHEQRPSIMTAATATCTNMRGSLLQEEKSNFFDTRCMTLKRPTKNNMKNNTNFNNADPKPNPILSESTNNSILSNGEFQKNPMTSRKEEEHKRGILPFIPEITSGKPLNRNVCKFTPETSSELLIQKAIEEEMLQESKNDSKIQSKSYKEATVSSHDLATKAPKDAAQFQEPVERFSSHSIQKASREASHAKESSPAHLKASKQFIPKETTQKVAKEATAPSNELIVKGAPLSESVDIITKEIPPLNLSERSEELLPSPTKNKTERVNNTILNSLASRAALRPESSPESRAALRPESSPESRAVLRPESSPESRAVLRPKWRSEIKPESGCESSPDSKYESSLDCSLEQPFRRMPWQDRLIGHLLPPLQIEKIEFKDMILAISISYDCLVKLWDITGAVESGMGPSDVDASPIAPLLTLRAHFAPLEKLMIKCVGEVSIEFLTQDQSGLCCLWRIDDIYQLSPYIAGPIKEKFLVEVTNS